MIARSAGRRLRLTAGAAALLLALTACGQAVPEEPATTAGSAGPAEPTSTVGGTAPVDAGTADAAAPEATAAPTGTGAAAELDASAPVRVSAPVIGLDAELIRTGMRADGTLEVPPGHEGAPASWYTGSPTPGERGPSVLLGQVNSLVDESGVFFDLERLREGDEIAVAREDGSTAVFAVYAIESFEKDEFPTRAVYYPVAQPELRLITCQTGDDPSMAYPNNLVVFATLTAVR